MILRKYRWSKHYESAEEELLEILKSKHIDAERWQAAEYKEFPALQYLYDQHIWCAEGSITFKIDRKEVSLQTGDTLDLPAGTTYEALAGFSGCVCYSDKISAT